MTRHEIVKDVQTTSRDPTPHAPQITLPTISDLTHRVSQITRHIINALILHQPHHPVNIHLQTLPENS